MCILCYDRWLHCSSVHSQYNAETSIFLKKSFSFLKGGGDEGVKGIHLIQNNILMLFLVNMFINIKQFDILSAINNLFCKETNICDCRLNSV